MWARYHECHPFKRAGSLFLSTLPRTKGLSKQRIEFLPEAKQNEKEMLAQAAVSGLEIPHASSSISTSSVVTAATQLSLNVIIWKRREFAF